MSDGNAATPADKELSQLRIKLLQIRLRRIEAQRKLRIVAESRQTWLDKAQAIELNRMVIDERNASTSTMSELNMRQLETLAQMNAVNDCFYIWHAGPFATINGFRLGRLPVENVDWSEINAGLGQVALLLATIEAETDLNFTCEIMPKGSFSQIHNRSTKQTNNLYSDGGTFMFQGNRSFSRGLESLLSCVSEAGAHIQEKDPAFRLPYEIEASNKIAGVPIVHGAANDEIWTRAMKYMLTDIKWIVAWASKARSSPF